MCAFAFDDTYDHEATTATRQRRVVLIVDVEEPMQLAQRLVNRGIIRAFRHTHYVRSMRANQQKWTRRAQGWVS
jgi:aspartyl/asparaginyl beta-hydroxylase (cupin superfamily)